MRVQTHSKNRSGVEVVIRVLILSCLLCAVFATGAAAVVLNNNRAPEITTRSIDDRVATNQRFGWDVTWGDFNGDGYDDLAIGVPYKTVGIVDDAGQVIVLYGSTLGLNADPQWPYNYFNQEVCSAEASENDDRFGYAVASGDWNADGYDDLAVGSIGEDWGENDVGVVTLIYGGPGGLNTGPISSTRFSQDALGVGAREVVDHFGQVLEAGDINGDGYDDVICGTPDEDIGSGSSGYDKGAVEILWGASDGITGNGIPGRTNQYFSAVNFASDYTGMAFGYSLAIGDFDGDGFDDVAMGCPGTPSSNIGYGLVHIAFGSSTGAVVGSGEGEILDLVMVTGEVRAANDYFGYSLAAADFDGDGFDDLTIGAPTRDVSGAGDAGMIYTVYGSADGFMDSQYSPVFRQESYNQADLDFGVVEPGDVFGRVLTCGDLNSDGYGDLAIGSIYEDIGSTSNAGSVGVVFGSSTGLNGGVLTEGGSQEDLGLGTSIADDQFGFTLACGDGDGDGYDDLAGGIPYKDITAVTNAGEVFVMYGSGSLSAEALPLDLPAVDASHVAWADLGGDSNLEFLLTGWNGTEAIAELYFNDGAGSFIEISSNIPGVFNGAADWADYDNDGDLDLLISGYTTPSSSAGPIARVYSNDGAMNFTQVYVPLPRVGESAVLWLDYNDDGKPDILVSGLTESGPVSAIYRNDSYMGTSEYVTRFTDAGFGLTGVYHSAAAWWDGYLALTGMSTSGPVTELYEIAGESCTPLACSLPGVFRGSVVLTPSIGNVGDGLDLMLTGASDGSDGYISRSYHWADPGAGCPSEDYERPVGISRSAADLGDYDNDGDTDLIMTGRKYDDTGYSFLYENQGLVAGTFAAIPIPGLPAIDNGDIAWADWDNDGVFEILLTGFNGTERVTELYRLAGSIRMNSAPQTPQNPRCEIVGDLATFQWLPGVDAETPGAGLSYALRVGTTPGGCEILSPAADRNSGRRRLVQYGNNGLGTSKTITIPPGTETLYWSVQTVDGGFAGSPFSAEQAVGLTTSSSEDRLTPVRHALHQNIPNPFNPSTKIRFDLAVPGTVSLTVYDAAGKHVKTLLNRTQLGMGQHQAVWLGKDQSGRSVATGVYFYVLNTEEFSETRRMILMK
jgi:FG-GAP repeat/FG-GAP-like repeat/FlgD Ig-like domain